MTSKSATRQSDTAYVCTDCDVGFATRQKLNRHMDWHHDGWVSEYFEKISRNEWLSGAVDELNGDSE